MTPKLAIPDNITVLALTTCPPRSPELNPVENVWQFMRDNWFVEPRFKAALVPPYRTAERWAESHRRAVLPSLERNLIDQPWKIMSLGMRKWAPLGSDQ